MQHVDQFLASYGYFALFGMLMLGIVGPLIPDETILVFAGIAIHRGEMHPVPAFLVATAGSLCGITVSYTLGRTGLVYLLNRIPILQRRIGSHLPDAHKWFDRYGKWTLFFGYFIAGVRHFTALVAGTSQLGAATFALYAYPGGCIWTACFLAIGYYLGEGWERAAHRLDNGVLLIAAIVVVVGVGWWLWKKKTSGNRQHT